MSSSHHAPLHAAPHAFDTIAWRGDHVVILDQTLLPEEERYERIDDIRTMWEAIRMLRVRGAPAIGIAAAFGAYLGVRDDPAPDWPAFERALRDAADYLRSSRPTAVNLFWALARMEAIARDNADLPLPDIKDLLLREALAIRDQDEDVCRRIGEFGASLLADRTSVLTHCNAGGLATARYGTALAVILMARRAGKDVSVFVDETRPLLQGARLTAWELMKADIPATLICDNMAASVMAAGKVQAAIVGTDRVAANGDVANKIGTYGVALAAAAHAIPFYVAAPTSSIDLSIPDGAAIPIEERGEQEITEAFGRRTAPRGVKVFNPAFDVTPARLVTAIITEHGICRPPYATSLPRAVRGERPE